MEISCKEGSSLQEKMWIQDFENSKMHGRQFVQKSLQMPSLKSQIKSRETKELFKNATSLWFENEN